MNINSNTIGLKELRLNFSSYIAHIEKGESFVVFKNSKPVFKIVPIDDNEQWETVVDFTKINQGGVPIDEILTRL